MPPPHHLLLQGTAQAQQYVSTWRGRIPFDTPPRDTPVDHGTSLTIAVVQAYVDQQREPESSAQGIPIVPLVLTSEPKFTLYLQSLDNRQMGLELINVRNQPDGSQQATVHIPATNIPKLLQKFVDYAHNLTGRGKPANQRLAESITELRLAMLRNGDYWMDSGPLPAPEEEFWWEIWLRSDGDPATIATAFRDDATRLGIRVSDQETRFPDYVVILAYTSFNVLLTFPALLRHLGELRRASIVPTEFLSLPPAGQHEFIHAMLERTTFAGDQAPAVCILDCGVNRGHPLLEYALAEQHNLAWNDDWTSADRDGHGTEMAGLALYGPQLGELLLSDRPIQLQHCLEAVKILPDVGENNPPDYGPITVGSVAKIEIETPDRRRTICMAITADDKDQGHPTLWSASLDQMCSGATDGRPRLMFVSAGNVHNQLTVDDYPTINRETSIQDPAQAWNVVTVGAYTDKVRISDSDLTGFTPLASPGGLCPRSTTSCGWTDLIWPLKPDIVMEGGNYAYDFAGEVTDAEDLSLLTTVLTPNGTLLSTLRDTSAATALAARYAALLHADYPSLWPETIRGLLIHSARWTPKMLEEFPPRLRHNRLRCYGYGVPDLMIARESASNRATMIIQESFQPFRWDADNHATATKDMHMHALPWPVELLRDLDATLLRMHITLSYFIEPSPGRKGWHRQHRYASHGLRFVVRRPQENMTQFQRRLTRAAWADDAPPAKGDRDTRQWTLGDELRKKGSIHSDVWEGTAAELAACGYIAVHPITGWWRERPSRRCFDKLARYSLIVNLECDDDINIYGAIQAVIASDAGTPPLTT